MRSGAKMNHRGGVYTTIFPTENIIIFFYAIVLKPISNFCRYLIDSCTKNFENPSIFFEVRRQMRRKLCAKAHTHWFCHVRRQIHR